MDINLHDLPAIIYACFVLHNYYEVNKESICENRVRLVMEEEQESQSTTQRTTIQSNESEGKRLRRVLTLDLDP